MKEKRIITNLLLALISMALGEGCCANKAQDDRLAIVPSQDSILNEIIQKCKEHSDRNVNPYWDTTTYYVTICFKTRNDSTTLDAMGSYNNPFILHDSICDYSHFCGYFLRNQTYCFFYESRLSEKHSSALDRLMGGWRIRDQNENPEFFPNIIPEQDPVVFEYLIDSVGKYYYMRSTQM